MLFNYFVNAILFLAMKTTSHVSTYALKRVKPYVVPKWADGFLENTPDQGRIGLANLPTPLQKIHPSGIEGSIVESLSEKGITLFVKRDDSTGGVELGGNKIRKLEFLLADALKHGHDSVVTIGGEQSNHCRATAAAARMVGLEPHLILRTKRAPRIQEGGEDLGLTGNVLFDRMVGSNIYTCTPGEYGRLGSTEMVRRVCDYLMSKGRKPYGIPVGGSNALGSWGYIEAVDELRTQWLEQSGSPPLDHILCACGSGGTTAGIAIGVALAFGGMGTLSQSTIPAVHAVGVCDSPEAFYKDVSKIADQMGVKLPEGTTTEGFIRQHLTLYQGKGLGYAVSTDEELDFIAQFALETGIALDPVYSGKALYNFVTNVILREGQNRFERKNILFWHTGGALGLFEKEDNLLPKLRERSPVQRLDVYGKDAGIDISRSLP